MKKSALILSILAISLAACSKPKTEDQPVASEASAPMTATVASEIAPTGDTAETSLDWAGDYKGTIPCANCDGIKTELELKSNKTYELTQEYIGAKDVDTKLDIKGTFTFDPKNPSIITLDSIADNRKLFVGENYVEFRAAETGDAITGPLADQYKLTKEN
ncbi:copper resistance protein NlpE [Acinetobacter equi]|uniref:Copper homeostasis protein CutF n=1 Tax=Acinetobacter equi TaxID=1324350 RepID=A0A0N7GXS3_9GAMM|nr:copper resistance protein NlpE [Acinetobacter equi]ALH95515.1 hypothetical protein AOY20_08235 [Acinetobacter equi]